MIQLSNTASWEATQTSAGCKWHVWSILLTEHAILHFVFFLSEQFGPRQRCYCLKRLPSRVKERLRRWTSSAPTTRANLQLQITASRAPSLHTGEKGQGRFQLDPWWSDIMAALPLPSQEMAKNNCALNILPAGHMTNRCAIPSHPSSSSARTTLVSVPHPGTLTHSVPPQQCRSQGGMGG